MQKQKQPHNNNNNIPSDDASTHPVGSCRAGNDGKLYIIAPGTPPFWKQASGTECSRSLEARLLAHQGCCEITSRMWVVIDDTLRPDVSIPSQRHPTLVPKVLKDTLKLGMHMQYFPFPDVFPTFTYSLKKDALLGLSSKDTVRTCTVHLLTWREGTKGSRMYIDFKWKIIMTGHATVVQVVQQMAQHVKRWGEIMMERYRFGPMLVPVTKEEDPLSLIRQPRREKMGARRVQGIQGVRGRGRETETLDDTITHIHTASDGSKYREPYPGEQFYTVYYQQPAHSTDSNTNRRRLRKKLTRARNGRYAMLLTMRDADIQVHATSR